LPVQLGDLAYFADDVSFTGNVEQPLQRPESAINSGYGETIPLHPAFALGDLGGCDFV
jgi:hypothetical protein